mgnify:CR=1 FL=1|tara:strand:- start:678 stop:1256 length:579 start_codon:yes stop_codon:yes gene_type:complete
MKKLLLLILILFNYNTHVLSKDVQPIIEGNKNSKIKLIVYESLTCSHCADFHNKIYPSLKKDFIDQGFISLEFRNFPLDLAALNASKLAHCRNDGKSEILHYLYLKQDEWKKGTNILELNKNLKRVIDFKKFNLDFEKCLNNEKIENHILEERIEGSKKFEIEATPTLIINNKKFDRPLDYKNLKKFLKKMI